MNHKIKGKKLDRNAAGRKALVKSLSGALVTHEKVQTTHVKAQVLRSHIEKLITKAKKGDLATRRYLAKFLPKEENIKKMIEEIGPRYKDRNGGYTRIIKIRNRVGDGAPVSQIELV